MIVFIFTVDFYFEDGYGDMLAGNVMEFATNTLPIRWDVDSANVESDEFSLYYML